MSRIINDLDVICQHTAGGDIVPIKFRIKNDDGEYESYKVSGYKCLSARGVYTTPDGVTVNNNITVYECRVIILDYKKYVRLYFDKSNCKWRIGI